MNTLFHNLLTHCTVDGHFLFFQVGAIRNNAALVRGLWGTFVPVSLGGIPKGGNIPNGWVIGQASVQL